MKSIDKKIWLILVLLFMISGNAAVAQSIPSDIEAVVCLSYQDLLSLTGH